MAKSTFITSSLGGVLLLLLMVSCGQPMEETSPTKKDVIETVFASGELQAEDKYSLTAQTNGYISALNFAEGDVVQKGKVLVTIDNDENIINTKGAMQSLKMAKNNAAKNAPLLKQAENDIATTKTQMEQDKQTLDRYQRLLDSKSIAAVTYEEALLAYTNSQSAYASALENYNKIKNDADQQLIDSKTNAEIYTSLLGRNKVKAIRGGKVYKKYKEVGDYVTQGEVIADIANPDLLYAKVNIDESNISKIKLGQEAIVNLNTDKEKNYKGVVQQIEPSYDEEEQSFVCKIYLQDTLDFNIVNTQLQSNIVVGEQKDALLIPRNYIDFTGYVQVKGEEEKRKVETQFVSNNWVQVLSGIDENTVLVTSTINKAQ